MIQAVWDEAQKLDAAVSEPTVVLAMRDLSVVWNEMFPEKRCRIGCIAPAVAASRAESGQLRAIRPIMPGGIAGRQVGLKNHPRAPSAAGRRVLSRPTRPPILGHNRREILGRNTCRLFEYDPTDTQRVSFRR